MDHLQPAVARPPCSADLRAFLEHARRAYTGAGRELSRAAVCRELFDFFGLAASRARIDAAWGELEDLVVDADNTRHPSDARINVVVRHRPRDAKAGFVFLFNPTPAERHAVALANAHLLRAEARADLDGLVWELPSTSDNSSSSRQRRASEK